MSLAPRPTAQSPRWKQLMPPDSTGVRSTDRILLTPDGKIYVYGCHALAELYFLQSLQ